MNPHSDCTPTNKQTKALCQAQRRADPVKRRLEQSSNTVRRRSARTNQAVQEHESEQRAAAREEPGVREQEQSANTVRRAIAREEPGVQEHESEQRAAAREEPGVREHESEQRAALSRVSDCNNIMMYLTEKQLIINDLHSTGFMPSVKNIVYQDVLVHDS